jgi:hypothetical protein
VHFESADRAPVLIVGAEKSAGADGLVEFPGRPHLMVAEGWEEIAARIESWLDGVLSASAARQDGISA